MTAARVAASLPRIAVTAGEPAGVGPELVAALAATGIAADLVAIADADLLRSAAAARGIALDIIPYDESRIATRPANTLRCLHVPLRTPATPGRLDVRNASYVIDTLARASDGCRSSEFDALVTAPGAEKHPDGRRLRLQRAHRIPRRARASRRRHAARRARHP